MGYQSLENFWQFLNPGECLGVRDHFQLVSEIMRGKMRSSDFAPVFLRSFSFQIGNLSKLERLYLTPFARHAYAFLFDPGYESDEESIRRFAEQDWLLVEEQIDALLEFLSKNHVLFPRRYALIDWNLVETGRFALFQDGSKGITELSVNESPSVEYRDQIGRKIAKMASIEIWWQEDYSGTIKEARGRTFQFFGTSDYGTLVADPWTLRAKVIANHCVDESIKTETQLDPLEFQYIWGEWGPPDVLKVSPKHERI